ncbi:MAG: lysine--tRNA ligase [bacterium]|nr:lysine--tRNA ligase [bacterium]
MLDDIIKERLKKRDNLEKAGKDVYPASVKRTHTASDVVTNWSALLRKKSKVTVVGRVFAIRGQGGISFLDIKDEFGALQAVASKNKTKDFTIVRDNLDIGDFIEATGSLFVTKKGEKSVDVKTWRVITKSIRPIPSEWYGIADPETRLRQRYLELLLNSEARELFRKKSVFWQSVREFLKTNGFLEVETPVLQSIAGGADAEPFGTHMNALDIDLSLRISLELPLKKLLVAGYEKVFEIGRVFRNEGIDAEHLQDYSQMEYYWAYQDYEGGMEFVEKMYKYAIKQTLGTLKTKRGDIVIDWGKKWPHFDYFEIFKKHTGLDLNTITDAELVQYAKKQNIDASKHPGRGRLVDAIFKRIRHTLIQPCFVINPPVEIVPLAKRLSSNPKQVARFQPVAGGTELGTGYSELNDPVDQRKRFEDQMKLREAGDKEAQQLDEEYLEAMEYGMPPNHGFGFSERLFSILVDKPIRETVLFPLMRPKSKDKK